MRAVLVGKKSALLKQVYSLNVNKQPALVKAARQQLQPEVSLQSFFLKELDKHPLTPR